MSQGFRGGFQFKTRFGEEKLGYDGLSLRKVHISEQKELGVAIMSPLGDLTLRDTASLDLINVTPDAWNNRLGSALMHEFIKQIKEADMQHTTALIINPLMVRMIERVLREEQLSDRIYYHPSEFSWDFPSNEVYHRFTPLAPELAAKLAAKSADAPAVTCLMSL